MKKQTILTGLFLILLITSLACDAIGGVTPTVVIPATQAIATVASIDFNDAASPAATDTAGAPATPEMAATVAPAGTATSIPTVTPGKISSPTPTATPVPNSRTNPLPVGSVLQADGLQFFVSSITRPADSIVQGGNALNFINAAGTGKEYMFVNVNITCGKPADQECILSVYNFKLLGSDGVLINPETTIAGVSSLLTSAIFYGGVTKSGNIAFIVQKGDANIVLVYQTALGDKFYLALPPD